MEENKLNNQDLEKVSGGELNKDGTSTVWDPECPKCHSKDLTNIPSSYPLPVYRCNKCGNEFNTQYSVII